MTNEAKLQKTVAAKPKKRRRAVSLDAKKARAGWLFILPFAVGFLLIYLPIIFDSIRYSFYRIEILAGGGYNLIPVGFENYRQALFVDPDFVTTLLSGLKELAFDIPAIIIFSLFMAVLLNQKMAGRAVFRAIFFIPVILSTGIMESIESQNILSDYMEDEEGINTGTGTSTAAEIVSAIDIERLFANMKIGTGIVDYVTNAINNIYDIVNRSGVQMLIFLAGLQSISPAIYESCQIDGATGWETFWKITLPMISPMILVNAIYTIIDSFTTDSNRVMKFISAAYEKTDGNVISSAMSWMYFLIVMLIIALVAGIMSAYVFYQRRD
ncbi:MAG: sugar ABC transporter permease [Eubacteriales bacterium]|nr:sugar ABC transporter permease [Eubacteriales bacterium]MDY4898466.1 sugar ABC transporter permease [Eubacteriales bacterium]